MKKKSVMRIVTALAVGILLVGSLAGCGGKDSQENAANDKTDSAGAGGETSQEDDGTSGGDPSGNAASGDVYSMTREDLEGRKLTITSAEDWWHPPYQTLVDKYMEEFGVEIEVNILPADTASEVIKSQFSTGELADITMNSASPLELTYMRADEMLADMSQEPWVEKLSDTSGFEYSDGKLYGLPLASQDYWGFCANKKVLEDCGLTVPSSKEELIQCFEVLKEKGYIPFYSGAGDSWMCGNITSSGIHADLQKDPDLITKFNTNQTNYAASESFKAMLTDIGDWAEKGYFGDNYMSQTWDGMMEAVANDECGFNIGLTSWMRTMDDTYGEGTSDKLELIPYYIGENDTIYMSTCCELYASKTSENLDLAKHFFNWCTQQENLQIFYDGIGSSSIFKDVVCNTICDSAKGLMEKLSDGTYGVHVAHNAVIQGQDWDAFSSLMQEVYMGEMTPEEFCQQYDEFRNSICQALGMEGF